VKEISLNLVRNPNKVELLRNLPQPHRNVNAERNVCDRDQVLLMPRQKLSQMQRRQKMSTE
jgi:hypothetical protein